jgi:hypothetical protein
VNLVRCTKDQKKKASLMKVLQEGTFGSVVLPRAGLTALRAGHPVIFGEANHQHLLVLHPRADESADNVLAPPPQGSAVQINSLFKELCKVMTGDREAHVIDTDSSDNAAAVHFVLQTRKTPHHPLFKDDFRLTLVQDGKQTIKLHLHKGDYDLLLASTAEEEVWIHLRPEVVEFRRKLLAVAPKVAQMSKVNQHTQI